MPAPGADNENAHSKNITFTIKDAKSYVPVVTLSARNNKNCQNFLAKDLKDQFIEMIIKEKLRIKILVFIRMSWRRLEDVFKTSWPIPI